MGSRIEWRNASSAALIAKRRSPRPARSRRWISLAMNSSDSRGYPLTTYPIVGVRPRAPRSIAVRPLAIGLLQHRRKAGGAAADVETALHVRTRARGERCAQRRVANQVLELARQRPRVAARGEQARPARA